MGDRRVILRLGEGLGSLAVSKWWTGINVRTQTHTHTTRTRHTHDTHTTHPQAKGQVIQVPAQNDPSVVIRTPYPGAGATHARTHLQAGSGSHLPRGQHQSHHERSSMRVISLREGLPSRGEAIVIESPAIVFIQTLFQRGKVGVCVCVCGGRRRGHCDNVGREHAVLTTCHVSAMRSCESD